MGKLEKGSRERTRRSKITTAILTTLAITAAGMLNPQGLVSGVLRELKTPQNKRRARLNAFYSARKRLAERGFIAYQDGFWRTTPKGKHVVQLIENQTYGLPRPKRWDKKWRILIFDIKEERKALRNKVRQTLISLGFHRLQDSVWVYPYDCEDLVALLKADFKIGKDLLYIIADTIENDFVLRAKFNV